MRLIVRILAPIFLVLGLIAPASAATAAPAESERFETFAFDFNTCNGEFVVGQGTLHIVSKQQKDGSFIFHFNLHAQGVGSQGNEYVMNWNGQVRSDGDFSFNERFMAISKGSAPNQMVIFRFDSDGNPPPRFETDCRG